MIAPTATAITPQPPGRIGSAISPEDALRYLEALGAWRDQRRAELDRLDEAALAAADGGTGTRASGASGNSGTAGTTGISGLTGDILLSMALWKAVADRHDLLVATWDSGRVGPAERERLATLIWGRLDATLDPRLARRPDVPSSSGALAVSLPEAMRLSDALAASLRARLSLDPGDADITSRLRQLRAQLERVRDLVPAVPQEANPTGAKLTGEEQTRAKPTGAQLTGEPPKTGDRDTFSRKLAKLDGRLREMTEKARAGADVGGLVGPLEADAARTERDLIVGSATRAEAARSVTRAGELRAELEARGAAIRDLAARCVATVAPAPKLAVPDVAALGPVPQTAADVGAYLTRLAKVSRALNQAQAAYATALDERGELLGRLEAYAVKASRGQGSNGVKDDLAELVSRARQVLRSEPTDMARARALVAAHQAYHASLSTAGDPTRETT